jgi:predicted DNA-binding transcriptional regulator YafY
MFVPKFNAKSNEFYHLDLLPKVATDKQYLQMDYEDAKKVQTSREIRRLAIYL